MTPKQKARQLLNIFYSYSNSNFLRIESSLKCVEEILNTLHRLGNLPSIEEEKKFYMEVKKELENL